MPAPRSQDKPQPLEMTDLRGLSLKMDIDSRDPSSWQQLDNFDHYIDGSIRKILPPVPFGIAPGNNVLNFVQYRATDTGAYTILGVDANANLYNLVNGFSVGSFAAYVKTPIVTPEMFLLPGTYIPYNFRIWRAGTGYAVGDALLKYSATDGNLYVLSVTQAGTSGGSEPIWPESGSVTDGSVVWTNQGLQSDLNFAQNYVYIVCPGNYPVKYDGHSLTQVGVSAPEIPAMVMAGLQSPNLNGYAPTVGAFYTYTLFNPKTLHESSPAPLAGVTTLYAVDQGQKVTVPGALLPALSQSISTSHATSYQIIEIELPITIASPDIGQGFDHVRIYRTKDGGATPLLLQVLYDVNGNQITNADGSISISDLGTGETDYVALPTPQTQVPVYTVYEGYGAPNLVPDPVELSPNFWTDKSAGAIFLNIGGGLNGANAFEYDGTGTSSGAIYQQTAAPIPGIVHATYTLQGYIDATNVTTGTVAWQLVDAGGDVLMNAQQANGAAGLVTTTVTIPHKLAYYVRFKVQATVTNGMGTFGSNPILQTGGGINPTGYPTDDSSLVTPAPDIGSADPPPMSEWGAVFSGQIYLQDHIDKTKVWYSDYTSGDFESYGSTAYLRFPSDSDDSITTMLGVYDRLVVGKKRSCFQITGNTPQTFQNYPLDPQHGLFGKRAIVNVGSKLISLLNQGLAVMGVTPALAAQPSTTTHVAMGIALEGIIGTDVQTLTGLVPPSARDIVCFAYDTTQGLLLFAIQESPNSVYNDNILVLDLGGGARFANIPLQYPVIAMKEVEFPDGSIGVLVSCSNAKLYRLFAGSQDGSLTATAVSQPLPMPGQTPREQWGELKIFEHMVVDGQDLPNFMVSFSVDGAPFSNPVGLQGGLHPIGLYGKRLTVRFTHSVATSHMPILTYINIKWNLYGGLTR